MVLVDTVSVTINYNGTTDLIAYIGGVPGNTQIRYKYGCTACVKESEFSLIVCNQTVNLP